jgi:hypothetical protein
MKDDLASENIGYKPKNLWRKTLHPIGEGRLASTNWYLAEFQAPVAPNMGLFSSFILHTSDFS